jgi:hypothetical protein
MIFERFGDIDYSGDRLCGSFYSLLVFGRTFILGLGRIYEVLLHRLFVTSPQKEKRMLMCSQLIRDDLIKIECQKTVENSCSDKSDNALLERNIEIRDFIISLDEGQVGYT